MKISYAILVCNEYKEFSRLVNLLLNTIEANDEIVVVQDQGNTSIDIINLCNDCLANNPNRFKVYSNPLNRNFAYQKNFLNSKCTGDYIFNIDSDEYISEYFPSIIKEFLANYSDIDLFYLPRINLVNGITEEYIQRMRWVIDINGYINYPDYQARLYKNKSEIKWQGKVHETIVGYKKYSKLPTEAGYDLIHIKDFEKQIKQNNLYNNI